MEEKLLGQKYLKRRERREDRKKAITAMELILYVLAFVFVLSVIGGAFYMYNIWRQKTDILNGFNTIIAGLTSYYSSNQRYPAASDWSWDAGNSYIPPYITNGGWSYSCASNTMTITTPPIQNAKVRTQVLQYFQSKCDAASLSGNRAVCTLYNRVCY